MGNASIKFSTDILRRLGEELNPSPAQGILELVKNAYDADATSCHIKLIDIDKPGGSVRITDHGDGMDEDGILNGWLVLGRSKKKLNQLTRLGRQPAGSKGLGRLAALRMGTKAKLITRPRSTPSDLYKLVIDWQKFDDVTLVEDVDLTIVKKVSDDSKKRRSGTSILLKNLTHKITRADVKRLARELLLLADPFNEDPAGFKPTLDAPEYADLAARVQNKYFKDADYHLHATTDKNGLLQATVTDWQGRELFAGNHDDIVSGKKKKKFDCPPITLDLWVFILNQNSFTTKESTLTEVREWLSSFGGVHLYQNGLRVAPYGNPGNDWVEMNLLRSRSPEERPGTNTSIGRISITDSEGLLIQKTDRSGFIESDIFSDLKTIAQYCLEWMAKRRLEVAEIRRAKNRLIESKKSRRSKKRIERVIDEEESPEKKDKLQEAFTAYSRSRDREVKELQKDVQLYRTLSTAGITAATFAHEASGNPIKVITVAIQNIERRGKKEFLDQYDSVLKRPVDLIRRSLASLSVLGSATLKLVDHEKRRIGRVELHQVIFDVLETFKPFLEGRKVEVVTDLCPGTPYLRAAEAAVESIITNLINNSLTAFEKSPRQKRILLIKTEIEDGIFILHVIDNGPGIDGISIKDMWLPGQTTRPNGTGLGLTIVRDAVKDLSGSVSALERSEELEGAKISIRIPIIGV